MLYDFGDDNDDGGGRGLDVFHFYYVNESNLIGNFPIDSTPCIMYISLKKTS
jgi:hypothetical protein